MIVSNQFSYFYVFLSACFIENLVFARGTSVSGLLESTKSDKLIFTYGAVMALVTTPSVMLVWLLNYYINDAALWAQYRGIFSLVCLTLVFFAVRYVFVKKIGKEQIKEFDNIIIYATFGTASLATMLLAITTQTKFAASVTYSLGCAAGLIIAMLLIHSGRERLEISSVRKSFQGLPIILIYIGILSLAVYGLTGHLLPA